MAHDVRTSTLEPLTISASTLLGYRIMAVDTCPRVAHVTLVVSIYPQFHYSVLEYVHVSSGIAHMLERTAERGRAAPDDHGCCPKLSNNSEAHA
jgi:hypothetical protein